MELTKEQIKFLDEVCRYSKWYINEKGEVDVDGNVNMIEMQLTEIPVKFGEVSGWFDCSHNNITTLKNCPDSIGGMFNCFNNNPTKKSSLTFLRKTPWARQKVEKLYLSIC